MKWAYVVRYRKDGRMKDRYFGADESKAREFYEYRRKYLEGAMLMRVRPYGLLETFFKTEFTWYLGGRPTVITGAELSLGLFWLVAIIAIWRVTQ